MFIEELEEDKVVEQHFLETYIVQTDAWEENIVEEKVQPYKEAQVEVQQST
jgi:hypothetical protein